MHSLYENRNTEIWTYSSYSMEVLPPHVAASSSLILSSENCTETKDVKRITEMNTIFLRILQPVFLDFFVFIERE